MVCHILIPALSLALLTPSCSRKCTDKSAAGVPHLPTVKIDDVAAPTHSTVTIQDEANLREIAAVAYGHVDFSGFVARLNGIAVPQRVTAGTTLKTPSLPVALRESGPDDGTLISDADS